MNARVREAVKAAYPDGNHPPLLVHVIPPEEFFAHEARELRKFKLGFKERSQIDIKKPEYLVVIQPTSQQAKDKSALVWGTISLAVLQSLLKSGNPLLPRMCKGPGVEVRKQIAEEIKSAWRPELLEVMEITNDEILWLHNRATGIHRWRIKHGYRPFDVDETVANVLVRYDTGEPLEVT